VAFERIPKYLDSPISLLIFEPDEVIPAVVVYLVIFALGFPKMALLAGFGISRVYAKLKARYGPAFIIHKLYRWGLYRIGNLPEWAVREFYE